MLGLYLHVPFCQAICSYCNFNRGLLDAGLKARYVPALAREIALAGDGRAADTIFFGGGTPSLLDPDEIRDLVQACRHAYDVTVDAEITLETNPETATPDRLAGFRSAGVNRLSFGAQSFDDAELARLGRVHDAKRVDRAVADARAAGFDNISLDLMFWLPGQSRQSWQHSVDRAIGLEPEHVSFYLLELYPNAPLKEAMARAAAAGDAAGTAPAAWAQAADDEAADMYLDALDRFDAAGLGQYEISNVAKAGRASRHNLKYWTSGAWRGFGCGAHSTVDGRRWQNLAATGEYVECVNSGRTVSIQQQVLDRQTQVQEALFTGLRLAAGIDRQGFCERYGVDPWIEYGDALKDASDAGLIWQAPCRFGLTRQGMLLANDVLAVFV